MKRYIDPAPQYVLSNGDLASAGELHFFENGSTTTRKDTFADDSGLPAVKNTNPVRLTDAGRVPPIFGEGFYTVVAKDADGVQIWVRNDVEFTDEEGQFSDWNASEKYVVNDIRRYAGEYWKSSKINNVGNAPAIPSTWWDKIAFLGYFNTLKSGGYNIDEIVIQAGKLYSSTVNGNVTTPPGATWNNLTFNNAIVGNLDVTGTITGLNITKTAVKVSQTARSSTTTLAADPELSITGLANSASYRVTAFIVWDGNGSTANGLKIRVGTAFATIFGALYTANTNSTSANSSTTSNDNISGAALGFSKLPNSAGANEIVVIDAVVTTSGSGASSIFIEWAQSASNATSTRLNVGSNLTVTKL